MIFPESYKEDSKHKKDGEKLPKTACSRRS